MIILLTGGSACGKSTFAEEMCMNLPHPRIYLACMRPYGSEADMRIARHRKMRQDKGFETLEKYTDIHEADIPKGATVLLECLCNLTANEMFDENGNILYGAEEKIISGIKAAAKKAGTLIIVTNEVGSGGTEYDGNTNKYISVLGRINREAAKLADTVIETVCGIPVILKGSL